MRRLIPAVLTVLLSAALVAWLLWNRPPASDFELGRLPGVVAVQASGPTRPTATVVHLLDYHPVPPEHLAPPRLIVTGHSRLYGEHLDKAEAVKKEHETILRRLVAKHGTLTVYAEGLTDAEVALFTEKAPQLAKVDAEDIPQTRRMLVEVQAMKQTGTAKATADELRQMLAMHRLEMLTTGATIRLSGEGLVDAKALDDAEALRKAKPDKNGAIDAAANAAREAEMAKRLADVRGFAVVILGGKHDLSGALKKWAPGVRYLRVETEAYREAAGELAGE